MLKSNSIPFSSRKKKCDLQNRQLLIPLFCDKYEAIKAFSKCGNFPVIFFYLCLFNFTTSTAVILMLLL
uniref:Ovule protein n=1 Tax=Panagrolaimus sp. PS1159 TaxID=55785 RepID=A0AC35GTP9_9BILA